MCVWGGEKQNLKLSGGNNMKLLKMGLLISSVLVGPGISFKAQW